MSRISECLQRLQKAGRKALVPYLVAGDPHRDFTVAMMHQLVESGADIIELGVPFSDPAAEGPVIQLAHERALKNNISLAETLAMVKTFRESDDNTPVVLMGYANPVEKMGYERFASEARQAGIDGLLSVDMPPEGASALNSTLNAVGIDSIYLIAPTTTSQRIRKIADMASGYLYYVSLKGVTGAGHLDIDSVTDKLQQIRSITDLPVTVGFGIKDEHSAAAIAKLAEGVVVGSALVDSIARLSEHTDDQVQLMEKASQLIAGMRRAIDEQ